MKPLIPCSQVFLFLLGKFVNHFSVRPPLACSVIFPALHVNDYFPQLQINMCSKCPAIRAVNPIVTFQRETSRVHCMWPTLTVPACEFFGCGFQPLLQREAISSCPVTKGNNRGAAFNQKCIIPLHVGPCMNNAK